MCAHLVNVKLVRDDSSTPWGFRLEGGVDLGHPLNIQRVVPGSVAEWSGLRGGDIVHRINRVETRYLTHEQAKMEIIRSSNDFEMVVERGGYISTGPVSPITTTTTTTTFIQPMSAHVEESVPRAPPPRSVYDNTSHHANLKSAFATGYSPPIGASHNVNPVPFGQAAPPPGQAVITRTNDGRVQRIAHSDYNSPMGLYSHRNAAASFGNALSSAGATSPGAAQPSIKCGSCGGPIAGVMVKVHGSIPMHPECLKCCQCGINLRNIGYFYLNDMLYCEPHARKAGPPKFGMNAGVMYK